MRSATFLRTIDGDTFVALLNLAPRVTPLPTLQASIRVYNWSAAELREDEGPIMRDLFDAALRAARRIDVELKTMSFGRIVCAVWLDDVLFAGLLRQGLRRLRVVSQMNRWPIDDRGAP